jgi:hypothetical protein
MFKWLKNAWPWKSKSMTPDEILKSWADFQNEPAVKVKPALKKATTRSKTVATKPGLYANIHAKQERIKKEKAEGKPVEKMRKPGSKGAPTAEAFKQSAKTAKKK